MDSDEEKRLSNLLTLGQQGDQKSYEEFLIEASVKLRRYANGKVPSCYDPEDILQDTLLAIHRARHTYTPGRPVGPWMYAICENRIIDAFRKRQRMNRVEKSLAEDFSRSRAETTQESYRLERVFDSLKRLPRKQKLIIELLKLRELSVSEVSALTGMSESAVKVSAFRGYKAIRQFLGLRKK